MSLFNECLKRGRGLKCPDCDVNTRNEALEEAAACIERSTVYCGGHGEPPTPSGSELATRIRSLKRVSL